MGLTIFHHDVKNYDKWMDQVSDLVTDSDCFEEFIFRSIEAKNKTYKALNDEDAKELIETYDKLHLSGSQF